jgi:hypothetical protein
MALCGSHVQPFDIVLGIRCDHSLLLNRRRAQGSANPFNLASELHMESICIVEKLISQDEKSTRS